MYMYTYILFVYRRDFFKIQILSTGNATKSDRDLTLGNKSLSTTLIVIVTVTVIIAVITMVFCYKLASRIFRGDGFAFRSKLQYFQPNYYREESYDQNNLNK